MVAVRWGASLLVGAMGQEPAQSLASITLNSRAMATAGPRIPTRGTSTEGIQAAANSPVMAKAKNNRRYCKEPLLPFPLALEGAT